MITVRELIEVAGFDRMDVLAGEQFLENQLTGVTSFDSPDGYRWLRPGEFVLTTGFPFVVPKETAAEGLIRLIDALAQIGTPGFAIKLGRYISVLPEAVITRANERKMPILTFPMEKAWSDVIVPVVRHINDRQRLELEKTHAIYERFHQFLTAGEHVSSLPLLLHELLCVPISIRVPGLKWKWDVPVPHEELSKVDKQFAQSAPRSMTKPLLEKFQNGIWVRWLLTGGVISGAIVAAEMERELHPWEKVALEQSAALLSLEIERHRTVAETYQRFRNDFLQLLVSGPTLSRESLIQKAEEVGWELAAHYTAAVLGALPQSSGGIAVCKENLALLEAVRGLLADNNPSLLYGLDRENQILLLVPSLPGDSASANSQLRQLLDKLCVPSGKFICAGIGRCHPGWMGIEKSYREARISFRSACRLASASKSSGKSRICQFDKLGLERILFSDHPTEEAHFLAEECLGNIVRYDQEKNGQLLHTLQAFLLANGNHGEAAQMLYVHKNTIKYRLQLIRELTGLHPENGEDQMLFRIALTIHAMGDAG